MTYTADILSPWWLILSARIYVASDYPGCINSAIPDDPFRRNSTIPDDPYCKNSATSEDPYSLQKFCSRWWTRLHKYNPWWPILQIFWTPDDPHQCRNYVASDYPGCINSTINDDPTGHRNYATPANPSCCRTKQSRFILKGPEDDSYFQDKQAFSPL